jgi:hypothetical protein
VEGPFVGFFVLSALAVVEEVAEVGQSDRLFLPLLIVLLGCLAICHSHFPVDLPDPHLVVGRDVPFYDILQGVVVHVLQVVFGLRTIASSRSPLPFDRGRLRKLLRPLLWLDNLGNLVAGTSVGILLLETGFRGKRGGVAGRVVAEEGVDVGVDVHLGVLGLHNLLLCNIELQGNTFRVKV